MKLREYQQDAVNSIFEYFHQGNEGNPIVAMPTGTGKSVVIGGFIKRALQLYPQQQFMVLTHVKELVEQNSTKLREMARDVLVGVYSAGLKKKQTAHPVVFGGMQSVKNSVKQFGRRDLLLIDECHLLSPRTEGTYNNIITELKETNPNLKTIGFTATPYRLSQGLLTDGGFFTDFCYDNTKLDDFNDLIRQGFLAPLVPKRTHTIIDTSEVKLSAGDYNLKQLQETVNQEPITVAALKEIMNYGHDRKSWLIFASGIEHAEEVANVLNAWGIPTAAVHSKMGDKKRDMYIKQFKEGRIRCVANNGVLTTGFDHPQIDLIGMLRPTTSPGLWVQMLGRGTRPCVGKANCLVLDFAGNTERLGPINDPVIPQKSYKTRESDAPVKLCPKCDSYNHATARICFLCGYEFPRQSNISSSADNRELIKTDVVEMEDIKMIRVESVIYNEHKAKNGYSSILVRYYYGLDCVTEYISFDNPKSKNLAQMWWRQRCSIQTNGELVPQTTAEALLHTTKLSTPKRLRVDFSGKYPKILSHEF